MKNPKNLAEISYTLKGGEGKDAYYQIFVYPDADPRKNYAFKRESPSSFYSRTLEQTIDAVLDDLKDIMLHSRTIAQIRIDVNADAIEEARKTIGSIR